MTGERAGGRTSRGRLRTVVYTAQFGDYDPIMPVLNPDPDTDYVVLSDRRLRVPAPWRARRITVPVPGLDDRMRNRWCKLHATDLFPDHAVSVYVDAHLQIIGALHPLLEELLESGAPLALMPHPKSRSVAHEVERSLAAGRISPADLRDRWPQQRDRQRAAGFAGDAGIYFAAFILRDHRNPGTASVERAWWDELFAGLPRDQVALPFALWVTGTKSHRVDLDWSLTPYFRHWDHLPGTDRYRRTVRWFAARQALRPWYRWPVRLLTPRATFRAVAAKRRADPAVAPGE